MNQDERTEDDRSMNASAPAAVAAIANLEASTEARSEDDADNEDAVMHDEDGSAVKPIALVAASGKAEADDAVQDNGESSKESGMQILGKRKESTKSLEKKRPFQLGIDNDAIRAQRQNNTCQMSTIKMKKVKEGEPSAPV